MPLQAEYTEWERQQNSSKRIPEEVKGPCLLCLQLCQEGHERVLHRNVCKHRSLIHNLHWPLVTWMYNPKKWLSKEKLTKKL